MTLTDRIARKLYELNEIRACGRVRRPWEALPTPVHDGWCGEAKAVLHEVREPTETMLKAGYVTTHDPHASPAGGFSRWATWEEACEMDGWREEKARSWRASIDAELGKEGRGR